MQQHTPSKKHAQLPPSPPLAYCAPPSFNDHHRRHPDATTRACAGPYATLVHLQVVATKGAGEEGPGGSGDEGEEEEEKMEGEGECRAGGPPAEDM